MATPDEVLIGYVTCADAEEARRIGRALVEERLAACVNIRSHEAIYRWRDAVEQAPEFGMIVKTTRGRWPDLEARIRELHGYELPCIVAFSLQAGLPAYLDWIAENSA